MGNDERRMVEAPTLTLPRDERRVTGEGDGLTVYVSGENVPLTPGPSPVERARGEVRALSVVHEPTIAEMLERFRQWMRLDVADGAASPETLRAYFGDVRDHLRWLFDEGLTPAEAGEDDLKAYRLHLTSTFAVSTAGRKFTSVRRFYGMAHARHVIAHNPAAGLKSPVDNTEEHERIKFLSMEQMRALMAATNPETAKTTNQRVRRIRDRAILLIMMRHGPRVVEMSRLDLEGLELDNAESPRLRVFGKRSKWRTLHLVEQTKTALEVWLAARALMKVNTQAVFVSMHHNEAKGPPGERMSTRGVRFMVDGYLEKIGAKKQGISCHALRHSFGTWSAFFGADLRSVQSEMGHADINTTMKYSRIVDAIKSNPAKYLTFLEDGEGFS